MLDNKKQENETDFLTMCYALAWLSLQPPPHQSEVKLK